MLMAERTPRSNGLRRHRLHGRRDILAATLTVNHYAFQALWSPEHEKEKMSTATEIRLSRPMGYQ
jgi:hypothetical protein